MNTKSKGDQGEDEAARYLIERGFHVLKRNLRCSRGEVDIVVYKNDSLVFVEVKNWQTLPIEDLERSITSRKRSRIMGCAKSFLSLNPEWAHCRIRFDIIHVGPQGIHHFPEAFSENGFQ